MKTQYKNNFLKWYYVIIWHFWKISFNIWYHLLCVMLNLKHLRNSSVVWIHFIFRNTSVGSSNCLHWLRSFEEYLILFNTVLQLQTMTIHLSYFWRQGSMWPFTRDSWYSWGSCLCEQLLDIFIWWKALYMFCTYMLLYVMHSAIVQQTNKCSMLSPRY